MVRSSTDKKLFILFLLVENIAPKNTFWFIHEDQDSTASSRSSTIIMVNWQHHREDILVMKFLTFISPAERPSSLRRKRESQIRIQYPWNKDQDPVQSRNCWSQAKETEFFCGLLVIYLDVTIEIRESSQIHIIIQVRAIKAIDKAFDDESAFKFKHWWSTDHKLYYSRCRRHLQIVFRWGSEWNNYKIRVMPFSFFLRRHESLPRSLARLSLILIDGERTTCCSFADLG